MIQALALPAQALVNKRVPKTLLLEHGAPTSADKRHISEGVEHMTWVAAIKPTTAGIPAHVTDTHEYLEIAVLAMELKPEAKLPRLYELIHRAIPYPLVLIAAEADGVTFSLTHKRRALTGTDKVVIDQLELTEPLQLDKPDAGTQAFLASLALAAQPAANLYAAYNGWRDRITALAAARLKAKVNVAGSGAAGFTLATSAELAEQRRQAVAEVQRLETEVEALRKKAGKEKQMNRRIELNLEVKRLETALSECRSRL